MLDYMGVSPISASAGIDEHKSPSKVIYNVNGQMSIVLPQGAIMQEPVLCYNLEGKKCPILYQRNEQELVFETHDLLPGVYFVCVVINDQVVNYKFTT